MGETIIGGVIAGVVGIILFFFEQWWQGNQDKEKRVQSIENTRSMIAIDIDYQLRVMENFISVAEANKDKFSKDKNAHYAFMVAKLHDFPEINDALFASQMNNLVEAFPFQELQNILVYYNRVKHLQSLRREALSGRPLIAFIRDTELEKEYTIVTSYYDTFLRLAKDLVNNKTALPVLNHIRRAELVSISNAIPSTTDTNK